MTEREKILRKVKLYIDKNLDLRKLSYVEPKSIRDILSQLDLIEEQYYKAMSISSDQDFEIYYRRPRNSCFVNSYFEDDLLAWKANIDVQPLFNYYKAVPFVLLFFKNRD